MSRSAYQRPRTTQASVLEELRRLLAEGELRPGDPVRQERIAEQLGVSVIPVREALLVLEREGQLRYRPYRGYAVAELGLEELVEIYGLRDLLEAEAVRRAVPRLDEDTLERMRGLAAAVAEAGAEGDVGAAGEANRGLHFTLYEAAGAPFLARLIRSLWDATDAYRALYNNAPENRAAIDREHEEVLAALAQRDAARANEVLAAHRARALQTLRGLLGDRSARAAPR